MADSFYANLFASIGDKLRSRGGSKDRTEAKPSGRSSKSGNESANTPAKSPAPRGKGFVVGRTTIDLTPELYRDAVRARALKKRWIFVNGAALAFAVLVTSSIFASSLPIKRQLESELQSNAQLQSALGEYQEINQAVEQKGATEQKLNQAAGGAIDWTSLISALESTLPPGISIGAIGINATGSIPEKGASVRINFVADSPLGYADTLASVQSAQGVSNVQIGGLTSSENSYSFSATLDYDSSIKTNRFAPAVTGGN